MSHYLQSAGFRTAFRVQEPRVREASTPEAATQDQPLYLRLAKPVAPGSLRSDPPASSAADPETAEPARRSGRSEARPLRVGVFGRGRLGSAVVETARDAADLTVAWALGRGYAPRSPVDVVLDASNGGGCPLPHRMGGEDRLGPRDRHLGLEHPGAGRPGGGPNRGAHGPQLFPGRSPPAPVRPGPGTLCRRLPRGGPGHHGEASQQQGGLPQRHSQVPGLRHRGGLPPLHGLGDRPPRRRGRSRWPACARATRSVSTRSCWTLPRRP